MSVKAPNFLYPLQTDRKIQWTKDAVSGEKVAKKPMRPKLFSAPKKDIIRKLVKKSKLPSFGKAQKTRKFLNPTVGATLPEDPMAAPDPRPGNATHLSPGLKSGYYGYQP